jgi:2-polyprenyl-6-methoxyphenol hydroxylase-like FAD-dependent oxidoreductase
MGILETIRSRTTGEKGFKGTDGNNRPYALFGGGGLTNELEIMRGDLCDVLTNTVRGKENVRLQYNRHVTKIDPRKETVTVTIEERDRGSYEEVYDAVVAADGIRSKTRDLMLDPTDTKDCIKPVTLYLFAAFFTIPADPKTLLTRANSTLSKGALSSSALSQRPRLASTSSPLAIIRI